LKEAEAGEADEDGVDPGCFHGGEEEGEEYFSEAGGFGYGGWAFEEWVDSFFFFWLFCCLVHAGARSFVFWGLIAALFARIYYVMVWVWQTQSAKPTPSQARFLVMDDRWHHHKLDLGD